jgi:hypothetical protein
MNDTMKHLTNKSNRKYSLKISGVLFILFITINRMNVSAQTGLTIYGDALKNIISEKSGIRSAVLGTFKYGRNQLDAGFQTNLINRNNTLLSGFYVNGSREFKIRNIPFTLNGFWLWIAPSQILKETDYGCSILMKQDHFEVKVGTNFRTYSFRKQAIDDYDINKEASKLHENFNLLYSFSYNLRPKASRWNTGLSITNSDYFLINQETNPYMNVHFSYKVSSPVCLFAEAWYKTAGAINMSINYFGYTLRVGMIWKIK